MRNDIIIQPQQLAGIRAKSHTIIGQPELASGRPDQLGLQQILQPADLKADGRLRATKRLGCFGKPAEIDNGHKTAKQIGWNILWHTSILEIYEYISTINF
nr:hypothetical protein [uncultured Tateyamaria sp.]